MYRKTHASLHLDRRTYKKLFTSSSCNSLTTNSLSLPNLLGPRMENAIEAMELLDITPDLLVTTRSDHLPPGWDSHLFNDPLIFTDFCTELLEFVLLMTRPGNKRCWRPPPNHFMITLVKTVYQALPDALGQSLIVKHLSDTGLPAIAIAAKYEKDLGLLRHLICNTSVSGFHFETIPSRYPLRTEPD